MIYIMSLSLILFILGGVWIAFAIGIVGSIGLFGVIGERTFSLIGLISWKTLTSFTTAGIPLFIFMGNVINYSGLATRLYSGLAKLIHGIPGGIVQTNILASTLFAACSGSSVASAASLAPMSYREQVLKRGCDPKLVTGSLAAGGTLGILIPPSIMFILYGVMTEQSIGKLFMAGLIPGILLAILFMVYIGVRAKLQPELVPQDSNERYSLSDRLQGLKDVWPFLLVAVFVLGSIYGGIATPTESAAIGAVAALVIALSFKTLTIKSFIEICIETVRTSSMIYIIIIASNVMAMMLAYHNIPDLIADIGSSFSPYLLLLFLILMYLCLGMFFDGISLFLLTLPFVMPLVQAAGFDMIWFGVILVLLVECGLITPPVGMNLFVIQGTTGVDLANVIKGSLPFFYVMLLMIILIILFPQIAIWLPSLMS
jgi:C4-dicarboxylate transporter, DctM subunit